jgi:hypothetical protein
VPVELKIRLSGSGKPDYIGGPGEILFEAWVERRHSECPSRTTEPVATPAPPASEKPAQERASTLPQSSALDPFSLYSEIGVDNSI